MKDAPVNFAFLFRSPLHMQSTTPVNFQAVMLTNAPALHRSVTRPSFPCCSFAAQSIMPVESQTVMPMRPGYGTAGKAIKVGPCCVFSCHESCITSFELCLDRLKSAAD